jgi:hypothetical protein
MYPVGKPNQRTKNDKSSSWERLFVDVSGTLFPPSLQPACFQRVAQVSEMTQLRRESAEIAAK